MNKFIFLDVDGPLIPNAVYSIDPACSGKRSVMSTLAVGLLNHLCSQTGAKIVMNTSHNSHMVGDRNVMVDCVRHGIKDGYFAMPAWRTELAMKMDKGISSVDRLVCIEEYLQEHGPAQWVAFDDFPIPHTVENKELHPNLIMVNIDEGIVLHHVVRALEMLK